MLKRSVNPEFSGKKILLCIALFCAITGYIYGDYAVDSTRSMNSTHLSSIRTAFSGGSDVATYYWHEFIENDPTKGDTLLLELGQTERGYLDRFNADIYVQYAMWGAVGLDMPVTNPPTTDSTLLDKARDYLLNPNSIIIDDYLDLDEVWDSLATTTETGNTWMRMITRNTALMVDMLWDYVDNNDRIAMCAKLDSLADTLHYHLDRLKETWGMGENPQFFAIGPEATVLGYAGCVLQDASHIDFAKYLLFDYPIPYLEEPQTGYLDFFTTRADYVCEGTLYFGANLYTQLATFFTANLRMNGENLYNTEMVRNTISQLQNMIAPDMQGIPLDDCFYLSGGVDANSFFIDGLFEYYYNNTNGNSDNWLRWYFNEFKNRHCYGNNYPSLRANDRYFYPIFSYNPDKGVDIDGSYSMPSEITGETHSDEELTTFRSEITDQDDFKNSISMYVNHDNSLAFLFHEHSDQSSFQLFGFDNFMLIDTGYNSARYLNWAENAMLWHHSPYAHNLIIVNPDSSVEATYLEHHYNGDTGNPLDMSDSTYPLHNPLTSKDWEPRYRDRINPSNPQTISCPNPSFKEYFIHNDEIEKLRIYLDYEEDPEGNDTIRVTRNYYFLDDEYFVIVDDVENLNPGSSNTNLYWNQLHFKLYTSSNENVAINGNNIFTLDADDAYLYGTIGATSPFNNILEEKLPWGGEQSHTRRHQRIKSVVDDKETSYITLLMPTESVNNPITDIIDGNSYYAIEVYDAAKTPTEKSYYAVSDSLLDVSFTDIDINSDAGFVGLTYRPGYQYDTKITQFIMAAGDSLLYNDTTLVQCSDVDEIIVEYTGTELSVIVKSDDEYPQYKILRQGVDVDNFTSIGVENGENGTSNIGSIWYDDDYFYVNWNDSFSCSVYLYTPILVSAGNQLVIDNNTTVHCMNDDVKIEAYGDISIGDSVTFTSPDSVYWDGLYFCNPNASIEIDGLTFENSTIENEADSLTISNGAFNNATLKQYRNKLFLSYTDFDTSNVYCVYTGSGSKNVIPDDVEINISYCTFTHYINGYAVFIQGYDLFDLSYNTISNCNSGIYLYNCGHPQLCEVCNNTIENNSGRGIQLYNSYADIGTRNTIDGNSYGILAAHNSTPSLQGQWWGETQKIYDNTNEEVVSDLGSFPDIFTGNIIYDDSYTTGTPDQYLLRCATGDSIVSARSLDAMFNYWGEESDSWSQWDGDDRFYPDTCFCYLPILGGIWKNGEQSEEALLYLEADSLFKQRQYKDVETLYYRIIDEYPLTKYAEHSIRNLLPLEAVTEQDFSSLRDYYLTDPICNISEERSKLCKYFANYCTIELGEYPTAISFFEDIIANPDTKQDSIYAVIDAGYTYLLMENSGKPDYVGKMPELKPKSHENFLITSDKLLSDLFGLVKEENNSEPETEYAFELRYNYPNPFRGSTKISFSLPASTQKADLKIYNIRGQLVRELDIDNTPGLRNITWDGLDTYGKKVGSGIYFYKLTADKKETIKKMVIIR